MGDAYSRFLITEMLLEVAKTKFTSDPARRANDGTSSGAILFLHRRLASSRPVQQHPSA